MQNIITVSPCTPELPFSGFTQTLQRLSEPGVTELVLPDCSRIEPEQMLTSLLQCRDTLRVLRLDYCGRCLGDESVMKIASEGGFPRMETAALTGEE